jgi:cytochrome c oxidase cbb3-type subunit I/II
LLYLTGALMALTNLWMTIRNRGEDLSDPEVTVPAPTWKKPKKKRPAAQTYDEALFRLDEIVKDGWHRALESWPMIFTGLTTVAVLIGTVVEFVPTLMLESNIPTIKAVKPYTPLELEGRDIYIREGCYNCHSQMIRPMRHEIARYGEYSKPGESIYDHPFQFGSKRNGPDLARVGGKYPHLWHVRHMEDPRSTSPRSVMPPYPWLLEDELDLSRTQDKIETMTMLNVPYDTYTVQKAQSLARAQAAQVAAEIESQGGPAGLKDKEIVALVAYLQRLGTDLKASAGDSQ